MYQIIKPTSDDFDELTCLWEASVRATHHFIPEAPKVHEDVLREIVEFAPSIGWQVQQLDYSPIKGPEGNIEFLGKITVRTQETEPVTPEIIHELVKKAHQELKGSSHK